MKSGLALLSWAQSLLRINGYAQSRLSLSNTAKKGKLYASHCGYFTCASCTLALQAFAKTFNRKPSRWITACGRRPSPPPRAGPCRTWSWYRFGGADESRANPASRISSAPDFKARPRPEGQFSRKNRQKAGVKRKRPSRLTTTPPFTDNAGDQLERVMEIGSRTA